MLDPYCAQDAITEMHSKNITLLIVLLCFIVMLVSVLFIDVLWSLLLVPIDKDSERENTLLSMICINGLVRDCKVLVISMSNLIL